MKKARVSRSRSDLERELSEQIELLQMHCASFDSGKHAVAKHIASVLRVLLNHHGNSQALLEQLGLRGGYFKSSAGPFNRKNLLPIHNLVSLMMAADRVAYVPSGRDATKSLLFADWWNSPVVRDIKGREFTRREIVMHVANTDGGAHVDPCLEEAYMDLSRNNSLGWVVEGDDGETPIEGRPELACIRQIASEVLITMKRKAPKFFG